MIIADEPTSALDVVVQRQVMDTLARAQTELGAAVILVGHDMGLMAQFVDRLGVMYAGRLVEISPVRDVFTAPLHPYTQMLIASLPSLDAERRLPGASRGSRRRSATSRPAARSIRAARSPWTAAGARSPCSARHGPASGSPAILRRARHDAAPRSREVTKTFGGGLLDRRHTVALRHFSLGLAEGRPSVTAVVGESGSGKTTLARLLLGLLTPTRGPGRSIAGAISPPCRGRSGATFRREVQAIFQDPYEVYNPFYQVDHVLTVPIAKFRLGDVPAPEPGP